MNATISENEIAVAHSIRPDVGREYLTININGWDDVKKLVKKVLVYDGRKFTFSAWDSEKMKCCFCRVLDGSTLTATVTRK